MSKWMYTINNGQALRDAIDAEDIQLVIKCLTDCCKELLEKLNGKDKENFAEDVQDIIDTLYDRDAEDVDVINDCLADFYDICDYASAWITL